MTVFGLNAPAVVCFTCGLTFAASAVAQPVDPPELLFNRGVEYMQQGLYEKACPALQASYGYDPVPGVLFTLAECEAKRGRIATAVVLYDSYLAEFAKMTLTLKARHQERATIAKAQREALSQNLPKIVLSLPPQAPQGTVVTWDGAALAPTVLGVEIPVDPGVHRVVTRTPDGQVATVDVSIAKGVRKQMMLDVKKNTDPPEILFNRGVQYMLTSRFEKACPAIQESYRIDPLPGTLFTLADCEAKRGRIATAAARYDDYLAAVTTMPKAQQARHLERAIAAKAQRKALTPDIPRLMLVLPPDAPAGTVVSWDDTALAEASLGVERPVDPGDHRLMTRIPGREAYTLDISIHKGTNRRIMVEVSSYSRAVSAAELSPAPTPPPAPLLSYQSYKARRIGAYVTGGVGLVGLVVGGVMGGLALGKQDAINKGCVDFVAAPDCTPEGLAEAERAKALELGSTISFGVGIAGLAAATVLFITSSSPHKVADAPSTARARWMSADVLSAGPTGVSVGLRGRF